MWDPHQILTKTAIQKKLEIDAFFSAIAFQSAYRAKIHQNNIFFIFKKLFLKSAHQIDFKTPNRRSL